MNKIAWLVRGDYGCDEEALAIGIAPEWEILWEEPPRYRYCEVKQVVLIEIDANM